jgi:hypothetical protein
VDTPEDRQLAAEHIATTRKTAMPVTFANQCRAFPFLARTEEPADYGADTERIKKASGNVLRHDPLWQACA